MVQPQPSTLLRIPAELRNSIYMLVFTEADMVVPHTRDKSNQLQHVCRQLHQETRWLELRYNSSIAFIQKGPYQAGPAQRLTTLPKLAFNCLRTVILTHGTDAASFGLHTSEWTAIANPQWFISHIPESAPTIIKLSELCSKHPLMMVRYILPGFSLDEYHPNAGLHFLIKGIFYRYALRELLPEDASYTIPHFAALFGEIVINATKWLSMTNKSLFQLSEEVNAYRHVITNNGVEKSPEQIEAMVHLFCARGGVIDPIVVPHKISSVPNLKFYPTCTRFDAVEFKYQMLHSTGSGIMTGFLIRCLTSRGLIDAWIDMAQKWVEDGI